MTVATRSSYGSRVALTEVGFANALAAVAHDVAERLAAARDVVRRWSQTR
jgi:hypothetical protein